MTLYIIHSSKRPSYDVFLTCDQNTIVEARAFEDGKEIKPGLYYLGWQEYWKNNGLAAYMRDVQAIDPPAYENIRSYVSFSELA